MSSKLLKKITFWLYISFISFALLLPVLVVVITSFDVVSYVKFPPEGITIKWYRSVLRSDVILLSIRNSLIVGFSCSFLALILGIPASLVIARRRFRGRELIYTLLLSSLTVPWIVIGVALLFFWGALGLKLSIYTLILGHTTVAIPYAVRTCTAVLMGIDPSYELAARNLGANRVAAFFHITLPMMRAGIIAGVTFAFLISFINVPVSLFVTTSENVTLPITIFSYMLSNFDPGVAAISTIQLLMIFLGVYIVERVTNIGELLY